MAGKVSTDRRARLRERNWPGDVEYWRGAQDVGNACMPRSLPLILRLLNNKAISGNEKIGGVYLDLLSRHIGQGVVEMGVEVEHAYASGYDGERSVRSWRERMTKLEELGFIRTAKSGSLKYGVVYLVHPARAIENLRTAGKLRPEWENAYAAMQAEFREATAESLEGRRPVK